MAGWFERFAGRRDGVERTEILGDTVTVLAAGGATAAITTALITTALITTALITTALITTAFPPLGLPEGTWPGLHVDGLVAHPVLPRRVGLLLVRLGGHSVGVAEDGRVPVSATDRTLVHGRNKAGGWSQQRHARRRAGQAAHALRAAAADAVRVLVPRLPELAGGRGARR